MHRYRGQKALYEAIKRSQARTVRRQKLEPLHESPSESKTSGPPQSPQTQPQEQPPEIQLKRTRWQRPRPVQLNNGRLEFALPVPIVFMVVMAFFLCILGIFRYGQYLGWSQAQRTVRPSKTEKKTEQSESRSQKMARPDNSNPALDRLIQPQPQTGEPVDNSKIGSRSGNAILIVSYSDRTQLVPVQEYFEKQGIATEIRPTVGGRYILVTKKRFAERPKKPGTEAYRFLQKVIAVGVQYQAPKGYLSFAPESFRGAYGIKLND